MELTNSIRALRQQLEARPAWMPPIPDELRASVEATIYCVVVGLIESRVRWQAPDRVVPWLSRAHLAIGPAMVQVCRAAPFDRDDVPKIQIEIIKLIDALERVETPGGHRKRRTASIH